MRNQPEDEIIALLRQIEKNQRKLIQIASAEPSSLFKAISEAVGKRPGEGPTRY